jgi:hypothetical protein
MMVFATTQLPRWEGHLSGGRVREIHRLRRRVLIAAPDPRLTGCVGEMVVVTELVDRLDMIKLLDAAIGPIKAVPCQNSMQCRD